MSHKYDEDTGVEKPTADLLHDLGWEVANGYAEGKGPLNITGRPAMSEVPTLLIDRQLARALAVATQPEAEP